MNIHIDSPGGFIGHMLVCGITAWLAGERGRNGFAWFCIAFFFSCLSWIALFCLPDLHVEEERRRRESKEHRRLRVDAEADRKTMERRHRETAARLDRHAQAIGNLEEHVQPPPMPRLTQPGTQALQEAEEEPVESDLPATDPRFGVHGEAAWYYIDEERQIGPVPFNELRHLWSTERIGLESYVWCERLDDWKHISEVEDLEDALNA